MDEVDDNFMADEGDSGDCPQFSSRTDYLIVVIAHFVEYPVGLFMLWVAYNRLETLKLRCYSPFNFVNSLVQVGLLKYFLSPSWWRSVTSPNPEYLSRFLNFCTNATNFVNPLVQVVLLKYSLSPSW